MTSLISAAPCRTQAGCGTYSWLLIVQQQTSCCWTSCTGLLEDGMTTKPLLLWRRQKTHRRRLVCTEKVSRLDVHPRRLPSSLSFIQLEPVCELTHHPERTIWSPAQTAILQYLHPSNQQRNKSRLTGQGYQIVAQVLIAGYKAIVATL